MMRTRSRIAAGLVSALLPLTLIATPSAQADPLAHGWVGSWHAAMTQPNTSGPSAEGFTDTTLRQVAHLSVGGDTVRVRLSNAYSDEPLVVGAATVAPRDDDRAGTPDVDADLLRPVTFGGRSSVTIPAGADWVSDPVELTVPDNSDLVVNLYLPGPTGPATYHGMGFATSFSASGDATTDSGAAFTRLDTSRYFLTGVDVTTRARGSVVFFGDSITDGAESTVDANLRYPDQVADRLLARGPHRCGVLNAGISGNRLLTDAGTYGESALARFDRDVLSRPGVHTVVLLEGINDIGNSGDELEAEDLIAVYRQFIARAHDAGLRVVGATLTPFEGAGYYTEAGEGARQAVNEWIRTSGEFDAVVDFDVVVRDPEHPSRFLPDYDVGDHLHPNDAGFTAMAAAVDLKTIC
ncbi:SGNH/GDSL hydrolase family protein [Saccharomonospora sp. NB11]|jgi:lysophospholipase L1-like esterase|uniref:SGNH/GDSL hydrolase family protein n=1 Tax=Saccharomonospora sp. NB11 TaxID=1642298 RepID=UPI0018D12A73|nr:SGNH/GDSL hydrolase family protein [Saccharomonospora sp. NB11]